MDNMLTPREIEDVAALLVKYEKQAWKGQGWDEWSSLNFPDELRNKWADVVAVCQACGFVGPHVIGGEIKWLQIVKQRKTGIDKCTMCPVLHDECYGKMGEHDGRKYFITCWQMERN